jgi:hypothetical protein
LAPKLNCYLLSVPFSIVIVYMIERQLFMILFSSFWTVDREKNEIFYIGKLLHNSDPTPQGELFTTHFTLKNGGNVTSS